MKKLIAVSALLILSGALFTSAQQRVEIARITAAASGTQTAANSDSIVCATDTRCIVTGSGTAGSAASGVLTVQGIASMTALQVTGPTGSATDKSGTVTTGGTSQTLAASNASRKCIYVINPPDATSQNISTAEILYINLTSSASTSATGTSIPISSGQQWSSCGTFTVTTEAITVTAATTGHHWVAKEQ